MPRATLLNRPAEVAAAAMSICPVPSGATICEPVTRLITLVRSEEHTSELQSQSNLVCRLLLEKKKHFRRYDGAAQWAGSLYTPTHPDRQRVATKLPEPQTSPDVDHCVVVYNSSVSPFFQLIM